MLIVTALNRQFRIPGQSARDFLSHVTAIKLSKESHIDFIFHKSHRPPIEQQNPLGISICYHPRMRTGKFHSSPSVCLCVCVSVCLSVCVSFCVSVCSGYNF